ncbi:hypothetical protein [Thermus sp.]|uniref:hypothetical protein n=1 Tax=Thermus sp. TaxID=275 RepID=UPI003D13C959
MTVPVEEEAFFPPMDYRFSPAFWEEVRRAILRLEAQGKRVMPFFHVEDPEDPEGVKRNVDLNDLIRLAHGGGGGRLPPKVAVGALGEEPLPLEVLLLALPALLVALLAGHFLGAKP